MWLLIRRKRLKGTILCTILTLKILGTIFAEIEYHLKDVTAQYENQR